MYGRTRALSGEAGGWRGAGAGAFEDRAEGEDPRLAHFEQLHVGHRQLRDVRQHRRERAAEEAGNDLAGQQHFPAALAHWPLQTDGLVRREREVSDGCVGGTVSPHELAGATAQRRQTLDQVGQRGPSRGYCDHQTATFGVGQPAHEV